jgi:hypothetical protein
MDRAILEAQLAALETQFAATPPGTPQQVMLQSQIATLQNELAYEPLVPPIFGPHPWHGGGGGFGPGPHGGGHR